jgi:hypothetical protein
MAAKHPLQFRSVCVDRLYFFPRPDWGVSTPARHHLPLAPLLREPMELMGVLKRETIAFELDAH